VRAKVRRALSLIAETAVRQQEGGGRTRRKGGGCDATRRRMRDVRALRGPIFCQGLEPSIATDFTTTLHNTEREPW
jgi:hypothetical protein